MGAPPAARDAAHKVSPATGCPVIWDLPVRLFHGALVVLVVAAWWTAEERMLQWHRLCSYALLSLLLFRLVWGVIGSRAARFSSFIRGPRTLLAYLQGRYAHRHELGHNPLGGWGVAALLITILCQIVLGLFAVDIDGIESGPLAWLIDFGSGRSAAYLHGIVFNVLLVLIGLHVIAVAYHAVVRGEPLIRRMVVGMSTSEKPGARDGMLLVRALFILSICCVIVYILVVFAGR